ncbi:hypothetical protein WMY93_025851 [Mugilogobius chulae]|uniref:Speriolin C-terminal domain-containing protein n=1 Tax=Mugilogobius chulae TaxID=88201 RepID=A0AAW0N024_9GOBI
MANQPDIVVVDKEQRRAVVVDVVIPSDGNIRRKEHEKLEKYQGLREELEKAWKVKATVVPVVIAASTSVTTALPQSQSVVSEELFKMGLQQSHRTSSPVHKKHLLKSTSYVEENDNDSGFNSQRRLVETGQRDRLSIGQEDSVLYFDKQKRFYGFTLTNIPSKITEVSTHFLTGKVDEDYRLLLNQRYENIKEILSEKGYKISLHPQFSEFIVNTFGILLMRPEVGSSQEKDFHNPMYLMRVIETTAPKSLQKDLVLLLSCLCELAQRDEKPIFFW